jgi:hypothetical protein
MMAITKKLFQLLVADLKTIEGKIAIEQLCEQLKIKLWKPKEKKAESKTYLALDIIKKSRFQRTQYLEILKNYTRFLDVHAQHGRLSSDKVKTIWNLYVPMISRLCNLDVPQTTIEAWDHLGRSFMTAFISRYAPEHFTPYMHVFVAHIGHYLGEHGEIESLANYDIETKNGENKDFVHRGSNRFGGRQDYGSVAVQQLQREYRTHDLDSILQPKDKKRSADDDDEDDTIKPKKRRKYTNESRKMWSTDVIEKSTNETFAAAELAGFAQKNQELFMVALGLEETWIEDKNNNITSNNNNNNLPENVV